MYQYNLRSMLLDNNGILSSFNWKKHINIIYFLIKDIIEMGELKVKYCLTGKILSGHFTKLLQEMPYESSELRFRESRRTPEIQTWDGTDLRTYSNPYHRSVLKEMMERHI